MEEEKPYWLFLDAERGTELSFNLFNYFPEAHYKAAIDQALEREAEERLRTDGGTLDKTYLWNGPTTETRVDGLFHDKEDGIRYRANYSSTSYFDDISRFELYEADLAKIGNAHNLIN